MSIDEINYFMVFDVESAGLHGEGFAFGYVVVNREGAILEDIGTYLCPVTKCTEADAQWLSENVLPHLPIGVHTVQPNAYYLRQVFWERWLKWKSQGAVLVTDCGWPVEANFLTACINDELEERRWSGPYPLFDLSSILLAAGKDPIGTYDRLPSELPAHNPLADARQSARILIETLDQIKRNKLFKSLDSNDSRFWSKVDKGEAIDDCWLWQGGCFENGYGMFWLNSSERAVRAHRLSYEMKKGEIPDGMVVMHKCDNPLCVNPEHLSIGTHSDNVRDCHEKGRAANNLKMVERSGEDNGRAKLTWDDAREIRRLALSTSPNEIAGKYGLDPSSVRRILRNETWKE